MIKKWEYMIVKDPKEGDLNKLGDEGWELVSVTDSTTDIEADLTNDVGGGGSVTSCEGTVTAYLKREKTE